MKIKFILFCGLLLIAVVFVNGASQRITAGRFRNRCGWFSNPTPANIWFYDREAEWTIGVQGGYQVPGDWPWPTFKPKQWVVTNAGDHGYGCAACLTCESTSRRTRVWRLRLPRGRLLTACRQIRLSQMESHVQVSRSRTLI